VFGVVFGESSSHRRSKPPGWGILHKRPTCPPCLTTSQGTLPAHRLARRLSQNPLLRRDRARLTRPHPHPRPRPRPRPLCPPVCCHRPHPHPHQHHHYHHHLVRLPCLLLGACWATQSSCRYCRRSRRCRPVRARAFRPTFSLPMCKQLLHVPGAVGRSEIPSTVTDAGDEASALAPPMHPR
jgi:hypothetical protein